MLRGEGAGFTAGGSVSISGSVGGLSLPLASVIAAADGSFSFAVTVPAIVPPGSYTITASDGSSRSAAAQLVVTP